MQAHLQRLPRGLRKAVRAKRRPGALPQLFCSARSQTHLGPERFGIAAAHAAKNACELQELLRSVPLHAIVRSAVGYQLAGLMILL